MALLQFKGKCAHTRRLRAKAPRGGTATGSENWWLLQEQKGNACTWEREQITARPLHEQVWGWDKAAAQLRLGSRTPLSKLPSFIMKSSFCSVLEATRASEMGCMSQRCKSEYEAACYGGREGVSQAPTLPITQRSLPREWVHPVLGAGCMLLLFTSTQWLLRKSLSTVSMVGN